MRQVSPASACPEKKVEEVVIRPARGEDEPAILECLRRAFEAYRTHYSPEAFADTVLARMVLSARSVDAARMVWVTCVGWRSCPSDKGAALHETCSKQWRVG